MKTNHNEPKTRPHTLRVCLAILCGAILSMAPGCSDDSNPQATSTNNDTGTCTITAGGIEICDGLDNDCDGEVDEDYQVGEPCSVQGCDEAGTQVCSEDQTSTMCERPSSCVGDMGEVDMPEDEGQPDQSQPCDNACGGQTPICDVDTDTCVQCLTNNECGNSVCDTATKSCVECLGDQDCTQGVCLEGNTTQDNACVECRGNAECLTAEASLCSAANECAPCAADDDCSHLSDLGQCVSGTCRECTTETEDADCGGNVCDPTTYMCTNIQIGNTGDLGSCISDTQCANGLCIALNYMGSAHGNYCMPIATGPGSCTRPFGAGGQPKTSVNGVEENVCMIRETLTTPEATELFAVESCDVADPTAACPEPGQICAAIDGVGTTKCTHRCGTLDDCKLPGTTCFSPVQGDDYCR